jgi:hypothetical protein
VNELSPKPGHRQQGHRDQRHFFLSHPVSSLGNMLEKKRQVLCMEKEREPGDVARTRAYLAKSFAMFLHARKSSSSFCSRVIGVQVDSTTSPLPVIVRK